MIRMLPPAGTWWSQKLVYNPLALRKEGMADFVPITGFFNLAYMPKDNTYATAWEPVDVRALPGSSHEVVVDLAPLMGEAVHALRYAWSEKLCCVEERGNRKACKSAACPVVASGGLPANPFLARIVGGRCECMLPQVCSS